MKFKTAIIFSGQGAQYPGMGRKWLDEPVCRAVFDAAGDEVKKICFDSTTEELSRTDHTQPGVYTVDLAVAEAAKKALAENGLKPDAVAGFSLGEYAALAYAGVFGFSEGLALVTERGLLMEEAGRGKGSMAAVLGDRDMLMNLIEELKRDFLLPVNFNCPGQTVVSGSGEALESLAAECRERKLRFVPLSVSGPFHSPVMAGVAERLFARLGEMELKTPALPVYANIDAQPYKAEDIAEKLSAQCKSPVLWEQTLKNMYDGGVRLFIEAGPGKTLTGLVKKTLPDAAAIAADETGGCGALAEAIGGAVGTL